MRLVLDHHYPLVIVDGLRQRGHDAQALIHLDWQRLDDEALLGRCAEASAVLMTNNVADFAMLASNWQGQGRHHAGLIFTSDATWPRTADNAGRFVAAIDSALNAHRTSASWTDRVWWLQPAN